MLVFSVSKSLIELVGDVLFCILDNINRSSKQIVNLLVGEPKVVRGPDF